VVQRHARPGQPIKAGQPIAYGITIPSSAALPVLAHEFVDIVCNRSHEIKLAGPIYSGQELRGDHDNLF
jgi:ABC-type molybdate transport system substrate-binding protein